MATRNEKIAGSMIGLLVGAFVGHQYAKQNNIVEEEKWKYILGFAGGGMLSGYAIASIIGSDNDTVNYELFHGEKRVYHGITYEDRISKRKLEHIADGKQFTRMQIDFAKPRVEALELEQSLIKADRPIYNVQHNN